MDNYLIEFIKGLDEARLFFEDAEYAPDLGVGFEYLSASLVWNDEMVPFSDYQQKEETFEQELFEKAYTTLKFLASHRGYLIKQETDSPYQELWDQAQIEFPDWPGFRRERQSKEQLELLLEWEAQLLRELDEIGDIFSDLKIEKSQQVELACGLLVLTLLVLLTDLYVNLKASFPNLLTLRCNLQFLVFEDF